MVISLLLLQAQSEIGAEAAARLHLAASRVAAIARVHRHRRAVQGPDTVAFGEYLRDLCRSYSRSTLSDMRRDHALMVGGMEAHIPLDVGIPLGLVANELITNAIRHGRGRVTVRLDPLLPDGLAMSITNEGSVLPEGFDPAEGDGLGLSLVTGLTAQLNAHLRIDQGATGEGTRFTVLLAI